MRTPNRAILPLLAILGAVVALSFPATRLALDIDASAGRSLLTADTVRIAIGIVLAVVACLTVIGGRCAQLSVALYLFALSRAAQPASVWTQVLPHGWRWLGALTAALVAGCSIYGYVALCMRMPNGEVSIRWRLLHRLLPLYAAVVAAAYGIGLLVPAFQQAYGVFAALIWVGYVVGLLAYLDQRRVAARAELVRTRWVAAAIGAHVVIEAAFLTLNFLGSFAAAGYVFLLNPSPYAFAYAMVRGRIVDVRVFGGRALVYAALSAVPITVFAVLDVLFAKELENARLAGLLEVGVAVVFSFWLQSLHRKIDRFVERMFFAARHRAHAAVERMIAALPFVERAATLETMLVHDVSEQLGFGGAAIYCEAQGGFALGAIHDFEGLPPKLDPDDALALYPRSSRSLVSLRDVPASRVSLPASAALPAFALPIAGGDRTFAIVLYGELRSGEALGSEEARLLGRLAHAAANTYEHLLLLERERENAQLKSRLDAALIPHPLVPV